MPTRYPYPPMPTTRQLQEPRFDHGLRRSALARTLLKDIFHGRLRAGERLVTQALASRFGVSHTPVREALIELAGVGAIDLLPNRGAIVRRLTDTSVIEICQVRKALECEAIRSACGRIELSSLQELADGIEPLTQCMDDADLGSDLTGPEVVARARELDDDLHDLISANCGNSFLTAELTRLKFLFRTFRDVAWEQESARSDYGRVGVEAREHLAIVRALLAENPEAAASALANHIRSGEYYWGRITANLGDDLPNAIDDYPLSPPTP